MASELPSHRANLINSSTDRARSYIQNKEIPQLFEALMTGLMFKQPDDHIDYIIGCLQKVKASQSANNSENRGASVKWNTFLTSGGSVDAEQKSLPPLRENANLQLTKEARIVSGKP
jgi:adenylate kinase